MRTATVMPLALAPLLTACFEPVVQQTIIAEQELTLSSDDIYKSGTLHAVITCEGEGRSPALSWTGTPKGTETFALVVDDPDYPDPLAPTGTHTLWIVYDIPATVSSLEPGTMPAGARLGTGSSGHAAYEAPCPEIGRHRYMHKLFALNRALGDLGALDPVEFTQRIGPAVIGKTELVGSYEKTQP